MQIRSILSYLAKFFSSLPRTAWSFLMKIEWGKFLANLVGVGVIGFCIGWLLGMAVSPVIANVITTVIGAAATLVAIMGRWQENDTAATAVIDLPDGTLKRLIQQGVIQMS